MIPNPSTFLHQRRWEDELVEGGRIVHSRTIQSPLEKEKERLANERIERLKEIEWAKREAKRHAQVRDDLRSQKMMKATGDEDWDVSATSPKVVIPLEIKNCKVIPLEIKNCKDENGNPFIVELERTYSDAE